MSELLIVGTYECARCGPFTVRVVRPVPVRHRCPTCERTKTRPRSLAFFTATEVVAYCERLPVAERRLIAKAIAGAPSSTAKPSHSKST